MTGDVYMKIIIFTAQILNVSDLPIVAVRAVFLFRVPIPKF